MIQTQEKTVSELSQLLKETLSQRDKINSFLEFFPLFRMGKMLAAITNIVATLSKIPFSLWKYIFVFLTEDSSNLRGLKVSEVQLILKAIESATEFEHDLTTDEKRKKNLAFWLRKITEVQVELDQVEDKEEAFQILSHLQLFLINNFPEIASGLRDIFSEKVLALIAESATKMAPGILVKLIIKSSVKPILIRSFGEEMGKRMMPLIGICITLVEFSAIIAQIERINNLQTFADTLLGLIFEKLIENGELGWPSKQGFFFVRDEPQFKDAKVIAVPRMAGLNRNGGDWELSNKTCKLSFLLADEIEVTLGEPFQNHLDVQNSIWKFGYSLDENMVEQSSCFGSFDLHFIFLEILIVTKDNEKVTANLVIGAKK